MTKATYHVKHKVRMGDYGESIEVGGSLEFDVPEDSDLQPHFEKARATVEEALRKDLTRAAEYTSYGPDDTYIHEYVEGEY